MRIAIDVNGVLRDTIGKFKQLYEKHLIENPQNEYQTFKFKKSDNVDYGEYEPEELPIPFEYQILSPITSLELEKHFAFQNKEEFYSFMYEEYCMELFGHAPSTEMTTFIDLNEMYKDLRDKWDFSIISDEIGKSKPSTLFFLSKFGCELERVIFYSNFTQNIIWGEFDVLLTANPNLLLNHPKDKILIKFETDYNTDIKQENSIKQLKELKPILEKILC